jgi:hypothetical protein
MLIGVNLKLYHFKIFCRNNKNCVVKKNYESKVNARQLTLHDNDRYRRLATFVMEITCGKSCLNFDGDRKIKEYR